MARGRYISDFELDVIRIAHAHGCGAPQIARYMGRTKMTVYNKIKEMREAGTLDQVPAWFPALIEDMVRAIHDQ